MSTLGVGVGLLGLLLLLLLLFRPYVVCFSGRVLSRHWRAKGAIKAFEQTIKERGSGLRGEEDDLPWAGIFYEGQAGVLRVKRRDRSNTISDKILKDQPKP